MVTKSSFLDRAMRAARQKFRRDVTQAELAALIGIRQPSTNDWHKGFPKIENGVKLAKALGCCVEWLYTENGPMHPWDTQGTPDPKEKALWELWNSLNENAQLALLANGEFVRNSGGQTVPPPPPPPAQKKPANNR